MDGQMKDRYVQMDRWSRTILDLTLGLMSVQSPLRADWAKGQDLTMGQSPLRADWAKGQDLTMGGKAKPGCTQT